MRWAVLQRALGVVVVVAVCSGVAQGRAQECGDNPMKQVLLVAKRAGWSPDVLLIGKNKELQK